MELGGNSSQKKELIFCLVETAYFGQCYFAATRNHYWNKEKTVLKELILADGQLIFRLVENIYFPFFGYLRQFFVFFFSLAEKYFSIIFLFSASGNGF